MPQETLTRYAHLVRDAFGADSDRADAIITDSRWPELASALDRYQNQGHPIDRLLSQVRRAGMDPDARQPTALSIYRLQEWAEGRPPGPVNLGMAAASRSHPHGPHEAAQAGADAAAAGASSARHRPTATAEHTPPTQQTPQRD